MRNCATRHGHGDHLLARLLDALPNGVGDFSCASNAHANGARAIADDNQRPEIEMPATLDHLGDARDIDHALLKFVVRLVAIAAALAARAAPVAAVIPTGAARAPVLPARTTASGTATVAAAPAAPTTTAGA